MSPLSAVYATVVRYRRSWYERHPDARRTLRVPVISVGNIAVGGSGKTPVVAELARLLQAIGHRPAVLSRGYARRHRSDGVLVVSDGAEIRADVERSGDEPQMLARMLRGVPVLVASDRYLAGRLAERAFGATVVVLDDGFQHLQLARTVDLVIVAPHDLADRVLPSGRLREPLDAAARADALLVPGGVADAQQVSAALGVQPAFTVTARFEPLQRLEPGADAPIARRIVAVAGIARPQRFFEALRTHGYELTRTLAFRDHHWFTARDVARIEEAARADAAELIVTTEKDAVRLRDRRLPWAALPMRVAIEPQPAFIAWLQGRL